MLNSILTNPVTLPAFLICLIVSVALGILTALVFSWRNRHSASFFLALAVLPMAVCMVIMLVNGNIGAGVAVAGAFALVRFRSTPGTAREIAAIFIAMTLGLATGMGYVGLAAAFFMVAAALVLILTAVRFGESSRTEKRLKITIPENLNYDGLFDDLFQQYGLQAELVQIKTSGMGTLFELTYQARFPGASVPKDFLDALRARNGNLTIAVTSGYDRETL